MKKLISALGALAVMTSVLSTGITDVPENETYVTVNAAVTSEKLMVNASYETAQTLPCIFSKQVMWQQ